MLKEVEQSTFRRVFKITPFTEPYFCPKENVIHLLMIGLFLPLSQRHSVRFNASIFLLIFRKSISSKVQSQISRSFQHGSFLQTVQSVLQDFLFHRFLGLLIPLDFVVQRVADTNQKFLDQFIDVALQKLIEHSVVKYNLKNLWKKPYFLIFI